MDAEEIERYRNGLVSEDPEQVLISAIWFLANSGDISQEDYANACDVLLQAALSDPECVRYIDNHLDDLLFKIQLFATVLQQEEADEGAQQQALTTLENIIEQTVALKATDTDTVSAIYSAIQDSGCAALMEKAQKLL